MLLFLQVPEQSQTYLYNSQLNLYDLKEQLYYEQLWDKVAEQNRNSGISEIHWRRWPTLKIISGLASLENDGE